MSTTSLSHSPSNPLLKPLAIFLIALSHSIGWGIRGDFGHESGAWVAGVLSSLAICLMSGRPDWWRRAGYCAFFGGLGWGFGGSISYMVPMSYASSGLWDSMWFGYGGVCLIGGLWAGMGGAGLALPLSIDRDRLTRLFTPLCFVLVTMYLGKSLFQPLSQLLKPHDAAPMSRHGDPLYWFDSDWYEALCAILGVCLYDLWDRRFGQGLQFGVFAVGGAIIGYFVQSILLVTGLASPLVAVLVVRQGDPTVINPVTNAPFDPEFFVVNWPRFLFDYHPYLGAGLGLVLGLTLYFSLYGKWRNDAGLFLSMAVGFLIAFLVMPVLLTIPFQSYGGFRLTPPRGDNWAGMIGVFGGMLFYTLRNGLAPVAFAGSRNFILGGIAFPTAHFLRSWAMIPGNPHLHWDNGVPPGWEHYHAANWHSVLEQSQGFVLGLITALTMASLWRRLQHQSDNPPVRRWTDILSIAFVIFAMTWVNTYKNVLEWTHGGLKLVPEVMTAPFFSWIKLSAEVWYGLAWWGMAAAAVAAMIVHVRRGLPIVPSSWAGRAQLIYFLFLWIMVVANLQRSMAGNFHEQRLVTEWLIIMHASLATFLMIVLPRPCETGPIEAPVSYRPMLIRTWVVGLIASAMLMTLYAAVNFQVYRDATFGNRNVRFGPEADWRIRPNVTNLPHR